MKQVPREIIDEIRLRNDIAEVIGSYLPLKHAAGRFKALCPFHKEKTPSFTVSPDRQIYHCFGCGAGGDVIRFVQEYEKIDFMTALQMLADRVGVDLKLEEEKSDGRTSRRDLFRVHEEAARLYRDILLEHPDGEAGRAYLATRALRPEVAEQFLLGFAPDRFDTLIQWARRKKIPFRQLEDAGLVVASENGRGGYDRFRNRLMFPIRDEASRIIGFSGRAVSPEEKGGKYINSPETPLFHKSRVLFAVDQARRAMAESRTAIVCEGQLDAIRCHEAGLPNVVASQGTALTSDHARILRRYADEVILVLDADAAGEKAALRSSEAFIAEELSVRVASLPAGEDPDSLIRDRGPDFFRERIGTAVSALDFLIDRMAAQENLKTEAGLMRTARAVQALIARAPGAVQRDRMVDAAAQRLGLSPVALRRDLAHQATARRAPVRPETPEAGPLKKDPSHPADETALLQLLLLHHGEVLPVVADHLPPGHLTDPDCRLLFELLLDHPADLLHWIPEDRPDIQRLAIRIQMEEAKLRGPVTATCAAQDMVLGLWKKALKRQRRTIPSGPESAAITMLLKQIDLGWEHAVSSLTA